MPMTVTVAAQEHPAFMLRDDDCVFWLGIGGDMLVKVHGEISHGCSPG
jgi:hypothetical protein